MPLRTMALARATEQVGRFAGAGPGECLALRSAGAHDRETFVPVMARSLVVCAGAAAVLAAVLGGMRNFEVSPAQAAVPSEIGVFLRPRVNLF